MSSFVKFLSLCPIDYVTSARYLSLFPNSDYNRFNFDLERFEHVAHSTRLECLAYLTDLKYLAEIIKRATIVPGIANDAREIIALVDIYNKTVRDKNLATYAPFPDKFSEGISEFLKLKKQIHRHQSAMQRCQLFLREVCKEATACTITQWILKNSISD